MTATPPRHRQNPASRDKARRKRTSPFTPLDFSQIEKTAHRFADHIESHQEELTNILLKYESFEVVLDETARTLDVLRNLHENQTHFHLSIGPVAAFLPRNQPLYALTCFVLIPSLMASEVYFRIPSSLRQVFPELLDLLKLRQFFPNVIVSHQERLEFLKDRSALRVDPQSQESWPVTAAVIFTGTTKHAERLRLVFDQRTLFIANGAGHNPIVVSRDADIHQAVEAVLTLQLYNQGQDCAAPNAILVHRHVYHSFLAQLRDGLRNVRVGPYRDRSCRVGPISDPADLVRIQELLIDNRSWLDPNTPGVIRSREAIVEPTIIAKPLEFGGNYTEVFAPILFVQRFDSDAALSQYFEHPHYARNAMYISLYGTSRYIETLIGRPIAGTVLHDEQSVLRNTHLHAPGMERGTQPYGGRGYGASSLSIQGRIHCKATLPQRDIDEWLVQPALRGDVSERTPVLPPKGTKIIHKDVQKLLGLKPRTPVETSSQPPSVTAYIDSHALRGDGRRYVSIEPDDTFLLLREPNLNHIAILEPQDLAQLRKLRRFLSRHSALSIDEFSNWLYALPKKTGASDRENRLRQSRLFTHLYQLLLGKESGPRLAHFLLDTNRAQVAQLLDV